MSIGLPWVLTLPANWQLPLPRSLHTSFFQRLFNYRRDCTRRQGAITRCGNSHLRRILVEAAWHYRHLPAMSRALRQRNKGLAPGVRRIAWEAQKRLSKRLYHLIQKGKSAPKAITALARELAGFVWAVGQEECLVEAG